MSIFGPVVDGVDKRLREAAKAELSTRMIRFAGTGLRATDMAEIAAWVDSMMPPQVIEYHQLLDYAHHKPGETWR